MKEDTVGGANTVASAGTPAFRALDPELPGLAARAAFQLDNLRLRAEGKSLPEAKTDAIDKFARRLQTLKIPAPAAVDRKALLDPLTTTNLPGLGFLWGGTNWNDSILECSPASVGCAGTAGQSTTVLMNAAAGVNYLNVVLDTKTQPESNHLHPSYGTIKIMSITQIAP